jgi:hypothetical protein
MASAVAVAEEAVVPAEFITLAMDTLVKGWQIISIKAIHPRLHMMMCMIFRCKGMASFSYHFIPFSHITNKILL